MTRTSSTLLLLLALAFAVPVSRPALAQVSVDLGVSVGGSSAGDIGGVVGGALSTGPAAAPEVLPEATSGLPTTLDQNGALEAIKSNRALPLEQIMTTARLQVEGEIVDAQLISVRGFLLYELKVIEPDGDVSDLYFYARSGERVRTN